MDDDVPATLRWSQQTKVIPGEGTYTVAADGTVTLVPEKSFTGTGTRRNCQTYLAERYTSKLSTHNQ